MAGMIEYLPGTRAMLVYQDEHGAERLSVVEVITRRIDQGITTYVVKARPSVRDIVIRLVPDALTDTSIGEGWIVGIVRADSLRPVFQNPFQLVK
jgi:hypothetical protein